MLYAMRLRPRSEKHAQPSIDPLAPRNPAPHSPSLTCAAPAPFPCCEQTPARVEVRLTAAAAEPPAFCQLPSQQTPAAAALTSLLCFAHLWLSVRGRLGGSWLVFPRGREVWRRGRLVWRAGGCRQRENGRPTVTVSCIVFGWCLAVDSAYLLWLLLGTVELMTM